MSSHLKQLRDSIRGLEIIDGAYWYSKQIVEIEAGSSQYFQLIPNEGSQLVMKLRLETVEGNPCALTLTENPDEITDGETLVTLYNRNRSFDGSFGALIYSDPTEIEGGILLDTMFPNSYPPLETFFKRPGWLLAPETNYVIRIDNSGSEIGYTCLLTLEFVDMSLV